MKIYYVANLRMPTERAHGIQLAKMAEAMIGEGVDLTIVAPKKLNKNKATAKEFYGLSFELPTVFLPTIDVGGSRFAFYVSAWIFSLLSFSYLFLKKLKGEKFIIYTIDLDNFSFFVLPLLGRNVYSEVHGSKKISFLTKLFFKKVSGVIAVSSLVKENLIKDFSINPEKIIIKPNGVDLSVFHKNNGVFDIRKKLGIENENPIMMYVGKFYDWKGLDTLVLSMNKIKNINLCCVGGDLEELIDVTGIKNIPKNIFCAGARPFNEIPSWMLGADFLIVTGTKKNFYSYYETSPMKLFEYFASSKPVVACRTKAIEGVVSEKLVSFYEPDDVDDLIKTVTSVLAHREEIVAKTKNADEWIKTRTWKERAKEVISFMDLKDVIE